MVDKILKRAKLLSAMLSGRVVDGITYSELSNTLYWNFLRVNAYIDTLEREFKKKDCCNGEINVNSSCLTEGDILTIKEKVNELVLTYKNY